MISDRKRSYLLPALLAAPPALLAGVFCSSMMPAPETVPAVVAANDPEVNTTPLRKTSAIRRAVYQVAGSAH